MIYRLVEYNGKINYTFPKAIIPLDIPVWGYAYVEDDRATNLHCKPVLGIIKKPSENYELYEFYEYKKNGKDLKSGCVQLFSRNYADTFEEAVRGYNQMVQDRIDYMKARIEKIEKMKMTLE